MVGWFGVFCGQSLDIGQWTVPGVRRWVDGCVTGALLAVASGGGCGGDGGCGGGGVCNSDCDDCICSCVAGGCGGGFSCSSADDDFGLVA